MTWHTKRKEPYTEKGIKRIKCLRCGAPAVHQWTICADGNNYRPMCVPCDIALNAMVLKFMHHPWPNYLILKYEELKNGKPAADQADTQRSATMAKPKTPSKPSTPSKPGKGGGIPVMPTKGDGGRTRPQPKGF